MVQEVNKTVYVTNDGTEFNSLEKAEAHELSSDIVLTLVDSEIYWRDTDAHEVVAVLLRHYNVTKK